jgi:3' terminal RNA ribose 2'-O-methyltransferase Hen1
VASSFLSVALAKLFREAMKGQSASKPELAQTVLPLTARIEVVNCSNGETFLRELFEPLQYQVTTTSYSSGDDNGAPQYFSLQLHGQKRLSELLTHLYVLMPVLDNDKHYWIGDDEVEKLLRRGEDWLAEHPLREVIVSRYLQRRHHLTRQANAQLLQNEEGDADSEAAAHDAEEAVIEKPLSLHQQRLDAVLKVLLDSGARRVLDLGCGEGRLLRLLLKEKQFQQIVGMDVSTRALEHAAERLRLDEMHETRRERITLMQGALTYRDDRLNGFDAAAVVEVIEHLDPPRLAAFEKVLFQYAAPRTVIITTPNRDYNSVWETLPAGKLRHKDHRFEWTRTEFEKWATTISNEYGYQLSLSGIGQEDEGRGTPTQMAVFTR